jgi:hypothetical protein
VIERGSVGGGAGSCYAACDTSSTGTRQRRVGADVQTVHSTVKSQSARPAYLLTSV